MPWKVTNVNEERMKFIVAWKTGGWSMSELCREFNISRKTGYKYLNRYEDDGLDGLKDRSHIAHTQPHKTREKLTELIVEMRQEHPSWGPRTLLAALKGRYPGIHDWPVPSTIGQILKREKLIPERKKRRPNPVKFYPLSHVKNPNDLWCTDFKGHFTVGNGLRCDPLTITDAHTRYLLECRGIRKTNSQNVKKAFEKIFHEYGIPDAIRSDNGSPFSSHGLAGLTPLAIWWLKLGIRLERIEPGKPAQNGRHERMHRTLKEHTALPPRSSLKEQQKAFDNFRKEYNEDRPHHALDMQVPASVYCKSSKSFTGKTPTVEYNTNIEAFRISDQGTFLYGMNRIFLSPSLRNEVVGLEEISERHRRIYFASAIIGILDAYTGKVLAYKNPMYKID